MQFLMFLACATAHSISSLSAVMPGGSPSEFYAVVRTEHWSELGELTAVDEVLIRCVAAETEMTRETTCRPVLTGDEAIRAAGRAVPTTFGPFKTGAKE